MCMNCQICDVYVQTWTSVLLDPSMSGLDTPILVAHCPSLENLGKEKKKSRVDGGREGDVVLPLLWVEYWSDFRT